MSLEADFLGAFEEHSPEGIRASLAAGAHALSKPNGVTMENRSAKKSILTGVLLGTAIGIVVGLTGALFDLPVAVRGAITGALVVVGFWLLKRTSRSSGKPEPQA